MPLPVLHNMRTYKEKYTKDILEEAVKNSFSYAGVLRYLNILQGGGNQTHIKYRINYHNINIDHFNSQSWMKGEISKQRITPESILKNINFGDPRKKPYQLTRALIEIGRPYECEGEQCCVNHEWLSKKITLHVDHIDGDYTHNTSDNLRFLCPNCHSQTDNFGSKNKFWSINKSILCDKKTYTVNKEELVKTRKRKDYNFWLDENNLNVESLQYIVNKQGINSIGQQFNCSESKIKSICKYFNIPLPNLSERRFMERKAERPSLEQLIEDLKEMSMVKVGKKYGVSDNAIRKWFKTYNYDYKTV